MRVAPTMLLALALALGGVTACGGGGSDPRELGREAAKPTDGGTKEAGASAREPAPTETATGPDAPATVERGDGNDRKIDISASDFPPGTWPLSIESGELRCEDTKTARTIIFSADGKDYPVNGVPEGGEIIGIEPIWKKKDDPKSPGTRMDIAPLFKKGYELCG